MRDLTALVCFNFELNAFIFGCHHICPFNELTNGNIGTHVLPNQRQALALCWNWGSCNLNYGSLTQTCNLAFGEKKRITLPVGIVFGCIEEGDNDTVFCSHSCALRRSGVLTAVEAHSVRGCRPIACSYEGPHSLLASRGLLFPILLQTGFKYQRSA